MKSACWWNGFFSLVLLGLILGLVKSVWFHEVDQIIGFSALSIVSGLIWVGSLLEMLEVEI